MNFKKLHRIDPQAEILNLETSEWIPIFKLLGITFDEYVDDPMFISPEIVMWSDLSGTHWVTEPGFVKDQDEIQEVYWTGLDGNMYGVDIMYLHEWEPIK